MKNIPLNCLALSSFGFSMGHLCFAFLFAASDFCFHISGHTSSGREVVCFLVSLHPDHVYPSGGLSFSRTNLVNPVRASDNTSSEVFVVLVTSMYSSEWGTFFLSARTVRLWVQRDDDK